MLYGIALATEGWGVVASLLIYPPFAGAAVSAITLVVSFGFAVSRPCLTLKVWIIHNEDFCKRVCSIICTHCLRHYQRFQICVDDARCCSLSRQGNYYSSNFSICHQGVLDPSTYKDYLILDVCSSPYM